MKPTFLLLTIISLSCTPKLFIYKGPVNRCSAVVAPIGDPAKCFELNNLCPRVGPSKQVKWKIGDTLAVRVISNWVQNKSRHSK